MSSATEVTEQIERTLERVLEEVPKLAPLKLIVGLELHGRGDVQQYRVALPGPEVSKGVAGDAKVRIEMPRAFFNEMAKDARVADWREAFTYGRAKATGIAQYLQLIERVVDLAQERANTRKV